MRKEKRTESYATHRGPQVGAETMSMCASRQGSRQIKKIILMASSSFQSPVSKSCFPVGK